ncbi:MAG: hypothetical protein AB1665_05315 [Candidatus Thermoplasmatota archaeon]
MPENYRLIEGKKYMWDGSVYEDEAKAHETKREYEGNGFETALMQEEGRYLLYTRRVVKEVVVESPPV